MLPTVDNRLTMKRRHEEKKKALNESKDVGRKPTEQKSQTVYFGDPKLIPRVRQYLSANRNKRAINITSIADDLQRHYGEYGRKKRNAFLKSVKKAYQIICEDVSSDSEDEVSEEEADKASGLEVKHMVKKQKAEDEENSESDRKSFSSDNPEYTFYEDRNSMNSFLTDMYKSSPGQQNMEQNSTSALTCNDVQNRDGNESVDCSNVIGDQSPRTGHIRQSVLGAENRITVVIDVEDQEDSEIKDVSRSEEPNTPKIRDGDTFTKERKTGRKTPNKQQRRPGDKDGRSYKGIQPQKVEVTFADVGGNEATLKEICKLLVHLRHPEVYQTLGVTPPRGFLLHGPPGCGKTLLAHAIAGELDLPFIKVAAPEMVSGVSGESEEKIRDLFETAVTCAPCIVFIDEIDAITPKRETASKDMERRIVAQLLSCLDELNSRPSVQVLVIGATNRPDSLDPALRRAGRFDREISLGIPDESARARILCVLCRGLKLSQELDFHHLARNTPGFVGADLMALAREATMTAVNRVFDDLEAVRQESLDQQTEDKHVHSADVIADKSLRSVLNWLKDQPPLTEEQLKELSVSMADFETALPHVQPSAKREGFATIPDVTWDDIGALQSVREELQLSILAPIRHREDFKALGLTNPPGILLAGPPGCGKTLLAKAIANESGINFISVKGPELLNMYVGESERAVRQVFQRARNSAPCVIFFDELDALCPRRSDSGEGGSSVRVVNQLLTEMDGLEERKQVFIMGATNRPDIIDPAILRPGRLDKLLYVGLPILDERLDILKTISKNGTKPPLAEDVNLSTVAEKCEGFSGADLAAIIRESSMIALKEKISSTTPPSGETKVHNRHFDVAFTKVKPSVSKKDHSIYDRMQSRLTS